jgi:CheY-like chemotaxis protein
MITMDIRLEALSWQPLPRRPRLGTGAGPNEPQPPQRGGVSRLRPERSGLPHNLVDVRVLVVDDDESTLEFLAAALQYCGAQVTIASSAAEALAALDRARPDVVLSDIAMREHDGYWLLREIRALTNPALSGLPVVAATAYGGLHSQDRTRAAGFTAHIVKPVDPETLCRAIASALGR